MTSTTSRPQRAARPWGAGALVSRLDSPVTSYYVLVGATAVLVVIGLVMVLSASMVTSYQDDGSSFAVFIKQAQFAVVGLVATVVAARLPVAWWKRLALPALVGVAAAAAARLHPARGHRQRQPELATVQLGAVVPALRADQARAGPRRRARVREQGPAGADPAPDRGSLPGPDLAGHHRAGPARPRPRHRSGAHRDRRRGAVGCWGALALLPRDRGCGRSSGPPCSS